jgi:hypothetical protein
MRFAQVGHDLADGSAVAGWLTAWGTVATAVGAVIAVAVTVALARRDRRRHASEMKEEFKRADRDRADAEQRFQEEVSRSEKQVREEREYADAVRRHERQQESLARLLATIADLMPWWDEVPNLYSDPNPMSRSQIQRARWAECAEAIRSLRSAVHAQLAWVSDARAAEQCRTLAHLVQTASRGIPGEVRERTAQDLRRYAIYVRVSLERVSNGEESLDPGSPDVPVLGRASSQTAPWCPENAPFEWTEAIRQEPGDPSYQPAD